MKKMQRFLQLLLVGVMVLTSIYVMPVQAETANTKAEYVLVSEKHYSYDSSAKKYTLTNTTTYKRNKKGLEIGYTSKNTNEQGYFSSEKTYNKAGKITSSKFYSDGKLTTTYSYTYDKKGRALSYKEYNNIAKKYVNTQTYKYSKDGTKATIVCSDGTKSIATFYSNGNCKTWKTYNANGQLRDDIKYDTYGNITMLKMYTTYKTASEYLENYSWTVEWETLKKKKVSSHVVENIYTYSNSKKGILKKITDNMTYYNESGKKVSSISYKGKTSHTYYTSGYCAGWIKKDYDSTYKYTKDKTGKNVGTQKRYQNGKLVSKTIYTWKKISK